MGDRGVWSPRGRVRLHGAASGPRLAEIAGPFDEAIRITRRLRATLLYVSFWDHHNARLHRNLASLIHQHADLCLALPPEPTMVDGLVFDPIHHFRNTRLTVPCAWSDENRTQTLAAVAFEVSAAGAGRGNAGRVAASLNARGIVTLNGRRWTAANLRAFLRHQTGADPGGRET